MNDEIREPYGMSDIEGIRKKYGDSAADSMEYANKKQEKEADNFFEAAIEEEDKKRLLELCIRALEAKKDALATYHSIITTGLPTSIKDFIPLSESNKKNRKIKELQKKIQKINDILIVPLKKIQENLNKTFSNEEKSIQTITWIMYAIGNEESFSNENSNFNKSFSEIEKQQLAKKIRKIRKTGADLISPNQEKNTHFNAVVKNIKDKKAEIVSLIGIALYDELINCLRNFNYNDFRDNDAINEIMEEKCEKYSLKEIENLKKEESFFEKYSCLKYHTKKQFNIENIDIEEYKRQLIKLEILKKIYTGLKEVLDILNEETSFWSEKNKLQAQKMKNLIIGLLPTISKMLNDTYDKIAKYKQYEETISKAYEVETELIVELGEILYKLRMNEKYDEERYEKLILIVKDENYKKAQEIAEELYQKYQNKKAIEEMKDNPNYTPRSEYAYLYNLRIEYLEEELRSLAGEDAIRFAKERAEMDANSKYPVIPDHHREPFDISPDKNAGKRITARKEYYRDNLIEKIIEIKEKQKEQESQKNSTSNIQSNIEAEEIPANNNIQPSQQEEEFKKELLKFVKDMLSKVTDKRPSDYYMYRLDEYPDFLPNINIDRIKRNRKYQNIMFLFLTPDEIKDVEKDIKRRIDEYLDFYYDVTPEDDELTDPREIAEQYMYEELIHVAMVEKTREKYKELTKGYSNN